MRIIVAGNAASVRRGKAPMTSLDDAKFAPSGGGENLAKRAASMVVLAPIVLWAIWIGGWPYVGLIVLAAALIAYEWCDVTGTPSPLSRWLGGATGLAIGIGVVFGYPSGLGALCLVAVLALTTSGPRTRVWPLLGVLYAGLPAFALLWLRSRGADGLATVMWVVLVVWATDIGAYLVGRLVGGPLLAPTISPGKTWSGAYGGLFLAFLTGMAVGLHQGHGALFLFGMTSIILAGVSIWGDLLESRVKRLFNCKDTSNLIPGHGGVMDRVDGLLTAVMVLAATEYLLNVRFVVAAG